MNKTLEFFSKELYKQQLNLSHQEERKAPAKDIENIKIKIGHYEKVCELLRKENDKCDLGEVK